MTVECRRFRHEVAGTAVPALEVVTFQLKRQPTAPSADDGRNFFEDYRGDIVGARRPREDGPLRARARNPIPRSPDAIVPWSTRAAPCAGAWRRRSERVRRALKRRSSGKMIRNQIRQT